MARPFYLHVLWDDFRGKTSVSFIRGWLEEPCLMTPFRVYPSYPYLSQMKSQYAPWNHVKSHEIPWNPMKSHEIPWNPMKSQSHGTPTDGLPPPSLTVHHCLHHWRRWSGWSSCLPWWVLIPIQNRAPGATNKNRILTMPTMLVFHGIS